MPIDQNLKPLRYVIPWCIKGTSDQTDWVRRNIGAEEVYEITGLTIDPEWVIPSILYIRDKEGEIYKKTYKFLEVQDYLAFRLGVDDFLSDYSQASCLSLMDIVKLEWSGKILDKICLSPEMLPKLVAPGEIVGQISEEASQLTGLQRGCPIVLGGADSQCSAVGCGVVSNGKANVVVGTSAVAMAYAEKPFFDPGRRLVTHPHCFGNKYIVDHQTLTGGVAYKWYRDEFCKSEAESAKSRGINVYELLNKGIEQSPPGANGTLFLPHFVGAASPYWNERATGVILGLTLSSKKEDIGRALIEGIALEVNRGFEIMRQLGIGVNEVCISGGGCKAGNPWSTIQADVYGMPVKTLCTNETTALGAAMLACNAMGIWHSVTEAASNMIRVEGVIDPNMRNNRYYKSLSEVQEQVYRSLDAGGVYTQLRSLNMSQSTK